MTKKIRNKHNRYTEDFRREAVRWSDLDPALRDTTTMAEYPIRNPATP